MRSLVTTAIIASAAMAALTASASAAVRVESTNTQGLVIRDTGGTEEQDVRLKLVREGAKQEWELQTGATFDEVGPGCRGPFFPGLPFEFIRCERLRAGVDVFLGGGDDGFSIIDDTLAITDPMTISMGTGSDAAEGAGGADTMQGGSGNDTLQAGTANDVLNGSDGFDTLRPGPGADTANGGSGNDSIFLATQNRDETDQVNGGIGTDFASYTERRSKGSPEVAPDDRLTPLRIVEANLETLAGEKDTNENDVLRSIENYMGGASADIITGVLSSNNSRYTGGLSNDQLFGTSGNNILVGSGGQDLLSGKAGNDTLDGKIAESTAQRDSPVDCGAGTADHAIVDLTDATTVGCEDTDRSAIGEGPHVRLRFRRVAAVVGGRLSARLVCPRRLRHPCAGTLALRVRRSRTARTRYTIKAGRSRRVSVRLGRVGRRVGRRTVGQLVSRERGDVKGVKTTSLRIVLSR